MVFDTNGSEYLAVNKTGVALWHLLLAGATRAVLAEAMTENFQIDIETAATDAERFVFSLEDLGLLEPPPAG
jgi:autotransporter adhesin